MEPAARPLVSSVEPSRSTWQRYGSAESLERLLVSNPNWGLWFEWVKFSASSLVVAASGGRLQILRMDFCVCAGRGKGC